MATRQRQRVVAIWGTAVSAISNKLNGKPLTDVEEIIGGHWLDEKHNITFLSCPKGEYQSNMNKVLPFADAAIITFRPGVPIDLDKLAFSSLFLATKNLIITYTHGDDPIPEIEDQIRDVLTTRLKRYPSFKNTSIPIIHKSNLTTDVIDSSFESLKDIEYDENGPLRGTTYRGFKVKGTGHVFAVKVESGSIVVGQKLSFSKSVPIAGKGKKSIDQTTCTVKSIRKFPGTEHTEQALPGDFVSVNVSLAARTLPLRGSVVTDIKQTTFKTVDRIDIIAQRVTTHPWIKVGANMVCYTAGTLCVLVVVDVQETEQVNTKKLVCSTLFKGVNVTFESDNMSLCKVLLMTGTHQMIGRVMGIPGSANCQTFEVKKVAEPNMQVTEMAAHAKVVLPPSFSNPILGLVLQQIVTKEPILNLLKDGVFTEKHAARVSSAVASCKPPPVDVLRTLCCDTGLGVEPDDIAKVMLGFLEELMASGCSETTEHKILQRLLGSPN
eukprot:TRINITY_DN2006_c0_g2_i2.p1 TRINITY_DN2006_c0_g2~~TRINITY_DN2006_c0_g2_i2.p1  ORF type:complete len:561 (+),score=121.93 TRINITY_DN2006_c0_g2_i2:201-1685(+)